MPREGTPGAMLLEMARNSPAQGRIRLKMLETATRMLAMEARAGIFPGAR